MNVISVTKHILVVELCVITNNQLMKVSSMLVISAPTKLHYNSTLLGTFSQCMVVSSLLVISVTIKLHDKIT